LTELTRQQYVRTEGRCASDATDREWALIALFLPAPKRVGRPRTADLRNVFDAILYIATTGCQWRMLPNDFPPVSTVRRYFYDWRSSGLLHEMNHHLVAAARQAEGRSANPTAGVIDSQSVKTTESGGVCGYDAPSHTCRHVLPGNGQTDQGSQAPHCDRYRRFAGRPRRSWCRCTGSPLSAMQASPAGQGTARRVC
jgi:transposase